jgi:hypothetical protein
LERFLPLVPANAKGIMRKSQLFIWALIGILMMTCGTKDNESVKKAEALLKVTKQRELLLQENINQANAVLDSISLLTKSPSSPNELLANRLKAVQQYITDMEDKLVKTEKELRSTRTQANAYMMMADAYKGEVEVLFNELRVLEDSVSHYKTAFAGEPMARKDK